MSQHSNFDNAKSPWHRLTRRLKHEFAAVLPPMLFFFVALHLVALMRVLMLEGTGIPLATSASVTVAALILGKAVLIADWLPFVNRYPDKPLIYNVIWKTAIYQAIAVLIHYLERLADSAWQAGGFLAGNEKLLAEIVWPHFWAIQLLLLVLIFMYCTMRELVRALGRERAREIFLGPRAHRSA